MSAPQAGEYDDDYATCADTHAAFRAYHAAADPADVTHTLGMLATTTQTAEPRIAGRTTAKPALWMLASQNEVVSRDLRRHLDWLIERLKGREQQLESLRRSGWRTDIGCFWVSATGHGGPIISIEEQRSMGALGLAVSFDIYFFGEARV